MTFLTLSNTISTAGLVFVSVAANTSLFVVVHCQNLVTFWIYGVIAILSWLFVYKLVPETMGRSLEEITLLFRQSALTAEDVSLSPNGNAKYSSVSSGTNSDVPAVR